MFNDRKETRRGYINKGLKGRFRGGGGKIQVPKQKGLT